jgi:hypothetical protein
MNIMRQQIIGVEKNALREGEKSVKQLAMSFCPSLSFLA